MSEIQFVTVGKGGTVHGTTDGEKTLCGKDAGKPVNIPGAELGCKSCRKEADKVETDKGNDVAETKKTDADTFKEVKRDVESLIEVLSTMSKDDEVHIQALYEQGENELSKLSANKKATLIMQLKNAASEARNRSAAIAVRAETTSVDQIEDYENIVANAAAKVAEGIKAEVTAQEQAKILAEAILDGRLRIFDKKGRPDLKGTRQQSKDLSNAIYSKAAEQLVAEGYRSNTADVDTLMEALQKKVRYQMTAVIPEFLRSLDNSPEQAKDLFPALFEKVTEDKPISELIFDEYKIDRLSHAERVAISRQRKKELDEKRAAGELEPGEDENEDKGSSNTKSQFDKDKSAFIKTDKEIEAVADHAPEYTAEQREEFKKLVEKKLAALANLLSALK
ncbi:hypothetical protein [Streptomyces chrestomyceticus]|uniref:hypothetical protein n=1 Tax=Streptomyces chrestomyceticus TaxID=68185 RepID=UPI0037BD4B94